MHGITITRDNATKVIALAKTLQDKIALVDNKIDKVNVANNLTTTEADFVLDARQGKALQDQLTSLNGSLNYNLISNATTDYNGVFTTNITNKEFVVLCAWCNLPDVIVIPYYHGGATLCFCFVDANGFIPCKNIENATIAYVCKKI